MITILSHGWIRSAGHYYSPVAMEAKEMIYPAGYDATKFFWLVNKSSAHGARSGLLPLIKGIIFRFFTRKGKIGDISAPYEFGDTNNTVYSVIRPWVY